MIYYPHRNNVFFKVCRMSASMKIALISLLIIFIITLYPFGFSMRGIDNRKIISYLVLEWRPSSIYDILNNILLFLPFGFGFSGYSLQVKGAHALKTLAGATIISFGISYIVEILQIFLPSRCSSLTDVFSNSVGGFLGFIYFYLWEFRVECIMRIKRNLLHIFLGCAALTIFSAIIFSFLTRPGNWDKRFHLLFGNEQTGNRPWRGSVSEILIADRAISSQEVALAFHGKDLSNLTGASLLCWYQLTDNGSYRDKTGHLSDLIWQGKYDDRYHDKATMFGPDQWLMTRTPAKYLTQRISKSSEFTIQLALMTANTMQSGPARIVTLSQNPSLRNFTIGQQNNDLIVRLRTPLTGKNGVYPEIVVADIFSSTKPRNLIITYSKSILRVYVDGIENSHVFAFNPVSTLASYLFPIGAFGMKFCKALYYALVTAPVGILCLLILKKYYTKR
ncbi:MAG: hypothetical protein CV082_11000 [Candidatus Brocadia sp. BL1]|nr:MAG: hypothetical protein CV082_11000 [Candidatus Brocadia sp. BL1]